MSKVTYRKTKGGDWVVYGPVALVRPGVVTVHKKDGTTKQETVVSCGKPFTTPEGMMVYGYLDRSRNTSSRYSGRGGRFGGGRRRCISDGNCSSMGNGQSCGGYDCDGW